MFSKINICAILCDHWRTMKNHDTKRVSFRDIALFFVMPIIISAFCIWKLKVSLDSTAIGILLASFAILTGLLFNLLVLVFDVIRNEKLIKADISSLAKRNLKVQLLKETFSSISYCVFLGISLSVFSVIGLWENDFSKKVTTFLVICGGVNFILTLLMILKRVHELLSHEFTDDSSN